MTKKPILFKDRTANLFVIIGQSNAVGLDTISGAPAEYQGVISGVQIYNSTNSRFETLQAGTNNEGNSSLEFGPELSLGRTINQHIGKTIYISKTAVGGTSLAVSSGGWLPPSGTHLTSSKADIDAAIQALLAIGKRPKIAGFFWIQGENDAQNQTHMEAYEANLNSLISNYRISYANYGANDAPFIISQLSIQRTDAHRRGVMYAQKRSALSGNKTNIVYTGDLTMNPSGGGHYASGAQITLGVRLANAWFNMDDYLARKKLESVAGLATPVFAVDSDRANIIDCIYDSSIFTEKVQQYNGWLGNIGTAPTSAARPLYFPNMIGSRDSIQFNGTSRWLNFGSGTLSSVFAGSGKKFTIAAVIKHNHAATTGTIIGQYHSSANQRAFVFQIASGKMTFLFQSLAGTDARAITGNSTISTSNHALVLMTYDGAISTGNGLDRVKMRVNGVAETPTLTTNTGSLIDIPTSTANLSVGAWSDTAGTAANGYFNGDIGELCVWNKILTNEEISAFEQYALNKWGIV